MSDNYTDDQVKADAVTAFRNAMIVDGWVVKALYSPTEALESYAKGEKEGFIAHVCRRDLFWQRDNIPHMRNNRPKHRWHLDITIWGPDGLCIVVPEKYDWNTIKAALRYCKHCDTKDVETSRFYFAGRACAKCLPALKAATEVGNWTE